MNIGMNIGMTSPVVVGLAAAPAPPTFDPTTSTYTAWVRDDLGLPSTLTTEINSWVPTIGSSLSKIQYTAGAKATVVAGPDSDSAFQCNYSKYTQSTITGTKGSQEFWLYYKFDDFSAGGGWVFWGWDGGFSGLKCDGVGNQSWHRGGTGIMSVSGYSSGTWYLDRIVVTVSGADLDFEWYRNGTLLDTGTVSSQSETEIFGYIGDTTGTQDHPYAFQYTAKFNGNLSAAQANGMAAYMKTRYPSLPTHATYT